MLHDYKHVWCVFYFLPAFPVWNLFFNLKNQELFLKYVEEINGFVTLKL